jgi:hypothetical protein
MPTWNAVKGWTGTNVYLALGTPIKKVSFLSPEEQEEYESLAKWFGEWQPPQEPFAAASYINVVGPVKMKAFVAARLSEECSSQVQIGIFETMRRLYAIFGKGK